MKVYKAELMRILALSICILVCQQVVGQSWFDKHFEIDAVEFTIGQSGITKMNWKDGMHGATNAMKYLTDQYDNTGLKKDVLTTTRPFNVEYSFSDYSGYCCGSDYSFTNVRSAFGVKLQSKKNWRVRYGISLNVVDRAFGDHDHYPLDDTPFGDHTIYFQEVGKTDVIHLSKGYGQDQFATTLYVPRAKLGYVAHPKSFIGLGLNWQLVLHESISKRNHFSINVGSILMTAVNNKTNIYLAYYDYQSINSGLPAYGHINDFYTNEYDYCRIEVEGRRSNERLVVTYRTPAINNAQINYGVEFSRQLFKNFPLTLSLGIGGRSNTYWRNWKTLATSKEVYYQGRLGFLLQKKSSN